MNPETNKKILAVKFKGPFKTLTAALILLVMLSFVNPGIPFFRMFFESTATAQAADRTAIHSLGELEDALSEALYSREESLNVRFAGDNEQMQEELPNILEGILREDDYLRYSIEGWRWRWTGVPGDLQVDFIFQHMQNREQDEYVQEEVERILGEIISADMDEHQVLKAVHDYIVASVAYDTSYEEYSAYAALSKGRAVCQGYALLTYKMLNHSGVETRIISGEAGNEKHAWNLVQLDGNWYHLDTTWNSPVPNVPGRVRYNFYNMTDEEIRGTHTWEEGQYPAADTPYQAPENIQLAPTVLTDYAGDGWPAQENTPPDKTWTIRFNQRLNPRAVTNEYFFVADTEANLINVHVRRGNDGRSVEIIPENDYPAGTYYLLVSHEIISQAGNGMDDSAWMEFAVP